MPPTSAGARRRLPALLLLLVACGGEAVAPPPPPPPPPMRGTLDLSIGGLPAGTLAGVQLTGPGGFSQLVTTSGRLENLTPGTYTAAGPALVVSDTLLVEVPAPVSATVVAGTVVPLAVAYQGAATARLGVTVTGLPAGVPASIALRRQGGGAPTAVTGTTTLSDLEPGTYEVAASAVSLACEPFTPSAPLQTLTLPAGRVRAATVAYAAPAGGALNFCIRAAYITQAVQAPDGSVPLVAGRAALARVFAAASRAGGATPPVRIELLRNGAVVRSATVTRAAPSIGTTADESTLDASWNLPLTAAEVQPGLALRATVDPLNATAEADETDNTLGGATGQAVTVRALAPFRVRLVPIISNLGTPRLENTPESIESYVQLTRQLWPIHQFEADVRAQPYTTTTVLGSDATSWTAVLGELNRLRVDDAVADPTPRYYVGIVSQGPGGSAAVVGIAYVNLPGVPPFNTALSWDAPNTAGGGISRREVVAHELGHNLSNDHAPCPASGPGAPDGLDPAWPSATNPGGRIGLWGWNGETNELVPPTANDIMGYCDTNWVSGYHWSKVISYRQQQGAAARAAAARTLLVTGSVRAGRVELDPAFETAAPAPATGAGPWTLEALDGAGAVLARVPFALRAVADARAAVAGFAVALPLDATLEPRLAGLRVRGPAGTALRTALPRPAARGLPQPSAGRARRGADGMELTWDATAYPAALVRDARTGRIVALARGGRVTLPDPLEEIDMHWSDGVRSYPERLRVR